MRALVAGLLALLVSLPAAAESIPPENVVQIFNECVAAKPGDRINEHYCRCLANQLRDRLSLQLVLTINAEVQADISRGSTPEQAVRKHPEFWSIAQDCRSRMGLPRIP